MKKMFAMFACLCMLLVAATVNAYPLYSGPTNSTIGSGASAIPAAPYDAGYYIWSNDNERFSWSIRWTNDSDSLASFFGRILYGDQVSGHSILFEASADKLSVLTDDGIIKWKATASSGWDGIDFDLSPTSLLGNTLQFQLGSSLFSNMTVSPNHVAATSIFIGDGRNIPMVQVQSLSVAGLSGGTISGTAQDFEIPAPVPEPGTMVLLGFGMLGLAIYGKRRMNKEA